MEAFLKTGKLGRSAPSNTEAGTSKSSQKKIKIVPWVEKYRPRTVDDVVEQGEVVSVLRQCLVGADVPNLLLYGPPGTGKTSTILAAARQLFGDMFKDRILELNASDDRGIQVIRDKVKTFANLSASSVRPDGKPCPPLKIIILDEADSMTHAAQAALRRTMEVHTRTTRFCLVCNYVSRIIPPIASRCTKFRFKPLGKEKMLERLQLIKKEEGVNCEEETLSKLVETSGGDMRKAITTLQSCARLKDQGEPITVQDVLEITAVVPDEYMSRLMAVCLGNKYNDIEAFVDDLQLEAYSAGQLLDQLSTIIINDYEIKDRSKAVILEKLAVCSARLHDGASEYIQLIDVLCAVAKALQQN